MFRFRNHLGEPKETIIEKEHEGKLTYQQIELLEAKSRFLQSAIDVRLVQMKGETEKRPFSVTKLDWVNRRLEILRKNKSDLDELIEKLVKEIRYANSD